MGISARLKAQYVGRIDELISVGQTMPMKQHSQTTSINMLSGKRTLRHYNLASWSDFVTWRTSCIAVLDQVIPERSALRKTVDALPELGNKPSEVEFLVAFVTSIRSELIEGSLDSIALQIQSEVLADCLGQASSILADAASDQTHVAAAVVAGITLEKSLKTLCETLSPPEPTANLKGAPLGLSALIDALKARGIYSETQAKQLRAWASIRNNAAHGNEEGLSRRQVEIMIEGIDDFLSGHLKLGGSRC